MFAATGSTMTAAGANGPFYNNGEATVTGLYLRKYLKDDPSFTPDEVARLDAVCAFANTFETASALSEFSHQEPGWCETPTGSLIPYAYAEGLQWGGADGGPIAQP